MNTAQSTAAFFATSNHHSGPLRKQKFSSTGSKRHVCGLSLVHFDPLCLFVSFFSKFVDCHCNIMIDGREKRNHY